MCKWWSLFIEIMEYEILSPEKNTPGLHEYIGEVLYGTIEIYLCMFCVWGNLIIGNPPIVIIIKMVLLKKPLACSCEKCWISFSLIYHI